MEIIGIDENGLGPILGPFIISGIKVKVKEPIFFYSKIENLHSSFKIDDSKNIFKRKEKWTYSKGEIISLSILKTFDFENLIKKYAHLIISDFEKEFYIKNHKLPIWAKTYKENNLREEINFLDYKAYAIFPNEFNKELSKTTKFQMDIKFFLDLAYELSSNEYNLVLCGKVGGYTYYAKEFFKLGITKYEILKENKGHSAYKIKYKDKLFEIHFLLDGDKTYYPIAIASIIGKYLRELFMKALNEHFGFYDEIPFSSGYKHDIKTTQLIEKIKLTYNINDFLRIK
jgi:ribonuclease HII